MYFICIADDFDPMTDDPENEGKCSVVIALMQIQRKDRCHAGSKNLQIGFILYQVKLYTLWLKVQICNALRHSLLKMQ